MQTWRKVHSQQHQGKPAANVIKGHPHVHEKLKPTLHLLYNCFCCVLACPLRIADLSCAHHKSMAPSRKKGRRVSSSWDSLRLSTKGSQQPTVIKIGKHVHDRLKPALYLLVCPLRIADLSFCSPQKAWLHAVRKGAEFRHPGAQSKVNHQGKPAANCDQKSKTCL